jgi:hypothetical protein
MGAGNLFDFLIVFFGWFGIGENPSIETTFLPILRLLRLLRVLKLLHSLPQLNILVSALFDGLSSIFYIFLLMVLTIYLFANVGVILFRANDPFHWGTLHVAAVTLFRMSTLEDWTDIMYINMYGCADYGYADVPMMRKMCNSTSAAVVEAVASGPPYNASLLLSLEDASTDEGRFGVGSMMFVSAVLFSVSFVLVSSLVMLSLFVGVVTTSMESARLVQKKERAIIVQINDLRAKYGVPQSRIDLYRQIFMTFDSSGDGSMDHSEFEKLMRCKDPDMPEQELKEWLVLVDENGDGDVEYVEFVKAAIQLEYDPNTITQRLERIAAHYERVNQIMGSSAEDRRSTGHSAAPIGHSAAAESSGPSIGGQALDDMVSQLIKLKQELAAVMTAEQAALQRPKPQHSAPAPAPAPREAGGRPTDPVPTLLVPACADADADAPPAPAGPSSSSTPSSMETQSAMGWLAQKLTPGGAFAVDSKPLPQPKSEALGKVTGSLHSTSLALTHALNTTGEGMLVNEHRFHEQLHGDLQRLLTFLQQSMEFSHARELSRDKSDEDGQMLFA